MKFVFLRLYFLLSNAIENPCIHLHLILYTLPISGKLEILISRALPHFEHTNLMDSFPAILIVTTSIRILRFECQTAFCNGVNSFGFWTLRFSFSIQIQDTKLEIDSR